MTTNGTKDKALATLITLADNIEKTAAQPLPSPRHKSGVMQSPAELVLYGDPLPHDDFERLQAAAMVNPWAAHKRPLPLIAFDGHSLLTGENISVISGKAKSRKSGFAALLAAMVINPHSPRINNVRLSAEQQPNRNGVLLFDTEQGDWHAALMARRILHLANRDEHGSGSGELIMYKLRDFTPEQRLRFIAAAIAHHADTCPLVIIDGVRDVVLNINSEDEATMISTWLLQITKRHDMHLSCVLHENKSSDTLRGHLGTELQNKAEAVFTIEKGTTKDTRELSTVDTPMCRNKGMERIGIESQEIVTDDGVPLWIPTLFDDSRVDTIGRSGNGMAAAAKVDAGSLAADEHSEIALAIWGDDPAAEYSPSTLYDYVQAIGKDITGQPITVRASREIIAHWDKVLGIIESNGKATKSKKYTASAALMARIRAIRNTKSTQTTIDLH